MRRTRPVSTVFLAATAVAVLFSTGGCPATRGRRGAPEHSGFLRDYSQLGKVEGFPAAEVYVDPQARWSAYDSVQIDSVTLWASSDTAGLSAEDRQMLTDTLYRALFKQLDSQFVVAEHAAPQTLRLRAALTQAKGANVPLRTVTTVVPQLRVLTTVTGLAADVAVTVGTATVEMEVLDSITGDRLGAGVDSRAGNKALFTTRTFKTWGDVEAACDLWSKRIAWQLARLGVRRKAGAPTLEDPT
jgi:hypothetical protein